MMGSKRLGKSFANKALFFTHPVGAPSFTIRGSWRPPDRSSLPLRQSPVHEWTRDGPRRSDHRARRLRRGSPGHLSRAARGPGPPRRARREAGHVPAAQPRRAAGGGGVGGIRAGVRGPARARQAPQAGRKRGARARTGVRQRAVRTLPRIAAREAARGPHVGGEGRA